MSLFARCMRSVHSVATPLNTSTAQIVAMILIHTARLMLFFICPIPFHFRCPSPVTAPRSAAVTSRYLSILYRPHSATS